MEDETRSEEEVSSLLTTRVKEATQTISGSKMLMKILTSIGLSALPYFRKFMIKECFNIYTINGKIVPYIKKESNCPNANHFHQLVESIRDTLDQGYLDKIIINIYKDSGDPDTLIESYEYVYSYHEETFNHEESKDGGNKSKSYDSATLVDKIKTFRDSIYVFTMDKINLPQYCDMGVYVIHNQNAPDDFCGVGFNPGHDDTDKVVDITTAAFKEKKHKLCMGKIETPFHTIEAWDNSNGTCFKGGITPNYLKKRKRKNNENVEKDEEMNQCSHKRARNILLDDSTQFLQEKVQKIETAKSSSLKERQHSDSEDETTRISCPCGRQFTSYMWNIVVCRSCSTQQHAECFGILIKGKNDNIQHYCDICAAKNSSILCSDTQMTKMSAYHKKKLSLLRTTLISFKRYHVINEYLIESVQHVSGRFATKLFKYATELGVFQLRNDDENQSSTTKIVNSQELKNIIPIFFSKTVPNTLSLEQRIEAILEDKIAFSPNIHSQSPGLNPNLESPLKRSNVNLLNAPMQEDKQLPPSIGDDKKVRSVKVLSKTVQDEQVPVPNAPMQEDKQLPPSIGDDKKVRSVKVLSKTVQDEQVPVPNAPMQEDKQLPPSIGDDKKVRSVKVLSKTVQDEQVPVPNAPMQEDKQLPPSIGDDKKVRSVKVLSKTVQDEQIPSKTVQDEQMPSKTVQDELFGDSPEIGDNNEGKGLRRSCRLMFTNKRLKDYLIYYV